MIAPAPRYRRPAPALREIVAEVAGILATGYLRLRAARPRREPDPRPSSLAGSATASPGSVPDAVSTPSTTPRRTPS